MQGSIYIIISYYLLKMLLSKMNPEWTAVQSTCSSKISPLLLGSAIPKPL